jgi:ABC-type protease/lipase transport system fused ATPase/permease subunit
MTIIIVSIFVILTFIPIITTTTTTIIITITIITTIPQVKDLQRDFASDTAEVRRKRAECRSLADDVADVTILIDLAKGAYHHHHHHYHHHHLVSDSSMVAPCPDISSVTRHAASHRDPLHARPVHFCCK